MKINVYQKFILLSLVVTVLLVAGLNLLTYHLLTKWLLENEGMITAQAIRTVTGVDLPPEEFARAVREQDAKEFTHIWQHLSKIPEVFRSKIYDTSGKIVWSDEPRLINRAYQDNQELHKALGGKVKVELGALKAEHEFERPLVPEGQLLEIYVPLVAQAGGPVYGVVEIYKHPMTFLQNRSSLVHTVWGAGTIGGLLLFLALARLFRGAWLEQLRVEDRLRTTLTALEADSVQLRALALEVTRAEQRERERLATLLHDDLQQLLVAAKLSLSALGKGSSATGWQERLKGVQDLLDQSVQVSRSLAVQLSPPALQEVGLVAALHQLAQHMHQAFGLTVEVTADAEVPADAEGLCVLLYQVVRELLLNVVKHADVTSARVSVRRLGAARTEILVADEGFGFDTDKLKGDGGSGLRNTRGRIELVGGSMGVESSPGQGTCVTITAPVGSPADGAGAPAPSGGRRAETMAAPARRIRVLIAEDYKAMRVLLTDHLGQQTDMEVVGQAANGEEAVRLAHSLSPDVVVMDIAMPGMDGVEATRRLRGELPGIRVVGLSAYGDPEHAAAMRAAGAVACLLKESSPERLADAIRTCVAEAPG